MIYDHSLTTSLRAGSTFTGYKVRPVSGLTLRSTHFPDRTHGIITGAGAKGVTRTYAMVNGVLRSDPVPAFTEADDGKQCHGDGFWVYLAEADAVARLAASAGFGLNLVTVPVQVDPADVAFAGQDTMHCFGTRLDYPAAVVDAMTIEQAAFEAAIPHAHVTSVSIHTENRATWLFDKDLVSVPDISVFVVNGQPPTGVDEAASESWTFVYDFQPENGQPWECAGGDVGTFAPVALLAPASGNLGA
jgi:hypothetical protein